MHFSQAADKFQDSNMLSYCWSTWKWSMHQWHEEISLSQGWRINGMTRWPSKVSFWRCLLCWTQYLVSTSPFILILLGKTDVKRRFPFVLLDLLKNCFVYSERRTFRLWRECQMTPWIFNHGKNSFYLFHTNTYICGLSEARQPFSCVGIWVLLPSLLFFLLHVNHVFCVPLHLVQRTYFWHLTNPRHTEETGYIIPVLPGVWRVPYGGTVLH